MVRINTPKSQVSGTIGNIIADINRPGSIVAIKIKREKPPDQMDVEDGRTRVIA